MTIIAAAFALAVALTPAHTAAEIVVLPAEQRGRDLVLEFDARFAAGAPSIPDIFGNPRAARSPIGPYALCPSPATVVEVR